MGRSACIVFKNPAFQVMSDPYVVQTKVVSAFDDIDVNHGEVAIRAIIHQLTDNNRRLAADVRNLSVLCRAIRE